MANLILGHLAILRDKKTGLYHGAFYRNRPTPSGLDRFLLDKSTIQGFKTPQEAAAVINADFPHLEPIIIMESKP